MTTGQGMLGNNMFAYCNNNPVMHSDPSGETLLGAMIGGAIGGALISVASHVTTNPNATVGSTLLALTVGAVTGALGGLAGVIKSVRFVASLAAGAIAGTYAAITTEGNIWQKLLTGFATGTISALSTYGGACIDTSGFDQFGTAVANYSTTVLVGSVAEPIAVVTQQVISDNQSSNSNSRWDWANKKQAALLGI